MTEILVDGMGWLGAALLLIPYYLVSAGKIGGKSKSFQLGNLSGSIFLMINSLYYGALPSVFVNIVWITIGITTLLNIYKSTGIENENTSPK